MKTFLLLLVLFALFGCAANNKYARWPYRGPMLEVTNTSAERITVFSRDGLGRQLVSATMRPGARACFRWPFIDARGELIAAGRSDTLTTNPFAPWDADGWGWSTDALLPIVNDNACR